MSSETPTTNDLTIYVVTTGEYSDYTIRGVYSTREKAEQAKRLFASQNDIEEFMLDNVPYAPDGYLAYYVMIARDGTIQHLRLLGVDATFVDDHLDPMGLTLICFIWAHDEAHARKIAGERHTLWRTRNFGSWIPRVCQCHNTVRDG